MQLRKQVPRGSSFKSIYKLKFSSALELLQSDVTQSIQVKMNKGDYQRTCYYSSQFPQVQSLQRHAERFETWTPQGTLSNVEEKE